MKDIAKKGKYKVVPVKYSVFYKQLPVFVNYGDIYSDPVLDLVFGIRSHKNLGRSVIKTNLSINVNNELLDNDEDTIYHCILTIHI